MAFDLDRFVTAQQPVWADVQAELAAGHKRTHWMWFVFPQLVQLGRSATARHYGIAGLAEAHAYLAHPLLGPRLLACVALLLAVPAGRSALQVMGSPDDLKLRSCMTLFAEAAAAAGADRAPFDAVLARYHGGAPDPATLALLAAAA